MPKSSTGTDVPQFVFVLQPEFPLNALVLASDALRIANQNSGAELFRWCHVSETGDPVRASNGMFLAVEHALPDMPACDVCLVFEGNLPTQNTSRQLLAQLRALARFGTMVGGVDTGAFALAQAGLIATAGSPDVVLHWEAEPSFREHFAGANPLNRINLIDGNRLHCAGGVAALDLMLDLIAQFRGEALADEIANALVHRRRPSTTEQRPDRVSGNAAGAAERLIALMEANLDFPLSLPDLAGEMEMSSRSLDRFCRRTFGQSPMRLYLGIRLQSARNFLFYDEYSVKDVALACGFSYPSVFTRAFEAQFGQTPRAFRATVRARQMNGVRPEIRRLAGHRGGGGTPPRS